MLQCRSERSGQWQKKKLDYLEQDGTSLALRFVMLVIVTSNSRNWKVAKMNIIETLVCSSVTNRINPYCLPKRKFL